MPRAVGVVLCLLLAAPFLGAGGLSLYSAGRSAWDAQRSRDWVRVRAEVVPGSFGTKPGEPGSAHFAYAFGGNRFEGRRLSLGGLGRADDIDAWRADRADELKQAGAAGQTISLWVNPDDPAESVLDRRVGWHGPVLLGLVIAGMGGAGLYGLAGAMRLALRREGREDAQKREGAGFFWLFALLWNGFCLPMSWFVLDDIAESGEWGGLFVLLFPFVGIFLFWAAMNLSVGSIVSRVARASGARADPGSGRVVRGLVDAPGSAKGGPGEGRFSLPASVASVTQEAGSLTIRFSRRRRLGLVAALLGVGLLLGGIAAALLAGEGIGAMPMALLVISVLFDTGAVALLVGGLAVRVRPGEIAVERTGLFGRKEQVLRRGDLKAVVPQLSYRVNEVPYFTVRAALADGNEITLGDTLEGAPRAGAYARRLVAAAGFPADLVRPPVLYDGTGS